MLHLGRGREMLMRVSVRGTAREPVIALGDKLNDSLTKPAVLAACRTEALPLNAD